MTKHNTDNISPKVLDVLEVLARNVHNQWMKGRLEAGWQQGPRRDDEKKEHPSLVSYDKLSEEEKEYDRQTVLTTINGLMENGFEIRRKDQ